jgi:hypothetical protein
MFATHKKKKHKKHKSLIPGNSNSRQTTSLLCPACGVADAVAGGGGGKGPLHSISKVGKDIGDAAGSFVKIMSELPSLIMLGVGAMLLSEVLKLL